MVDAVNLMLLEMCIRDSPVGRIIRFNQVPFRVVGVLKAKGYNSMGMDQDDVVLAPYSTVMKRLLAQTYLSGIFASALTEDCLLYTSRCV